jgi:hypothetical protein
MAELPGRTATLTPSRDAEKAPTNGSNVDDKPKEKPRIQKWVEKEAAAIWKSLQTNHLWQRMLKNTLATTIATIIAVLPAVVEVFGRATYLACITTVFGHPGRRFGQMMEALVLAVLGTLIGTGWATLGIYLSSLVSETDSAAAYTVKGVFLLVVLVIHGYLRSHTPRLFIMVLLMVIVTVVSLTGPSTEVTTTLVTTLLYPILTAVGVLLLVNVTVFPEFSSAFLGVTTIATLGETVGAVRNATEYFLSIESPTGEPEEEKLEEEAEEPTAAEDTPGEHTKEPVRLSKKDKIKALFHPAWKAAASKIKDPQPKEKIKLKTLTDGKGKLRAQLASCKAAQQECNFELAFAVLPPRDLKPISDTTMKRLVANTVALIGACESKYALMGDEEEKKEQEEQQESESRKSSNARSQSGDASRPTSTRHSSADGSEEDHEMKHQAKKAKGKDRLARELEEIEMVKPRREIEYGDPELFKNLIRHVKKPILEFQAKVDKVVNVVSSCLAYCYDVPRLPDGSRPPQGIELEELDIWTDFFTEAIADFDRECTNGLEEAGAMQDLNNSQVDIMPRMETFLVSSVILNMRQAALHTQEMLVHSRKLVEKRQSRHGRRQLWLPHIKWRKWLSSGGEDDTMVLPPGGRQDARTGSDKEEKDREDSAVNSEENLLEKRVTDEEAARGQDETMTDKPVEKEPQKKQKKKDIRTTRTHRLRNQLADATEYIYNSDDVLYALKLTIAVFLVTWPAFVGSWNYWYYENRGLWAALQLVLITEVAIGTSVNVFILRAVGTTMGCSWGFAAFEAGGGNRVILIVILVIGIIPSAYVQLGTKYVKAGMVAIISMCVVALATTDQTVPGSATENFLRRLLAFLIGAVVALGTEFVLFPVKARDRLVESLSAAIRQITEMEACMAYGIESETNVDVHTADVSERFEAAKAKAQAALAAAETFLPFTSQEPRLKGSFAGLALVYKEILFVLHQIVDKMDNMFQLRKEYGSSILEELNIHVYPYRRNVAGSITLLLFVVHEALTTKLPLPQFVPSARLAHLRMVNRVREVVMRKFQRQGSADSSGGGTPDENRRQSNRTSIDTTMVRKKLVRHKFLSWNAASAGQTEIIEYLEELIELVKLLVGANEFRSGLLMRPTYNEYLGKAGQRESQDSRASSERSGRPQEQQQQQQQPDTNLEESAEQDELRDVVPEQMTRQMTRQLTKKWSPKQTRDQIGGAVTKIKSEDQREAEKQKRRDEDELPRSLQRVRSRRLTGQSSHSGQSGEEMGRVRSRKTWDSNEARR